MLGLPRGTVLLCSHDPAWDLEARCTALRLKEILGDTAIRIEHVGSSAIPSIPAKPIVDLAVGVSDFGAVLSCVPALETAGFFYRPGKDDLPEQLLFACGSYYAGAGDLQTHFIHVVKYGGEVWRDYLCFRDFLRAEESAAKRYEAEKLRLAAAFPTNREAYLKGKAPCVSRLLTRARAWSFLGKTVEMEVDRPAGYVHRKAGYTLTYPLNYGYLPGERGGDGEALDVYLLGVHKPVDSALCVVIGAVFRENDAEDKLIAAPPGSFFSEAEMEEAVRFQERWYDSRVVSAARYGFL